MKKTLITLAALAMASVAQAELVYSSTTPESASNVNYTGENYAFTFTMVIDMDKILSSEPGIGDWNNKTEVQLAKEANWWENGIAIWRNPTATNSTANGVKASDVVFITMTDGDQKTPSTSSGANLDNSDGYPAYGADDAWNGKLAITYTFVAGEADASGNRVGTQTLYVLKSDKNGNLAQDTYTRTTAAWALDSHENPLGSFFVNGDLGGVEQLYVFNTAMSASEAEAFATKVIPEPTTATLSLLALAGLAARRRRK